MERLRSIASDLDNVHEGAIPVSIDLGDGAALRWWEGRFAPPEADAILARLRDEIAWEQMKFYGRPEPRLGLGTATTTTGTAA